MLKPNYDVCYLKMVIFHRLYLYIIHTNTYDQTIITVIGDSQLVNKCISYIMLLYSNVTTFKSKINVCFI